MNEKSQHEAPIRNDNISLDKKSGAFEDSTSLINH